MTLGRVLAGADCRSLGLGAAGWAAETMFRIRCKDVKYWKTSELSPKPCLLTQWCSLCPYGRPAQGCDFAILVMFSQPPAIVLGQICSKPHAHGFIITTCLLIWASRVTMRIAAALVVVLGTVQRLQPRGTAC
jgi:hypothetical protein